MDYTEAEAVAALGARGLEIPLDETGRRSWADTFNQLDAMRYLGVQLHLADPRVVRVSLPRAEDHHRGGLGTTAVNGAVIAGMFDAALGVAGTLHFQGQRTGTVELSLKFLRAVPDGPVNVHAVTLKKAPSVAFMEAQLFSRGRLCATGTGMLAVASARGRAEEHLW